MEITLSTHWQQFKQFRIKNKHRRFRKVAKVVSKVTLTVNLDLQDRLINGQARDISHIEYTQGVNRKAYVNFPDEQAGLKAMGSCYIGRQNSWLLIEKYEAEVPIKKGSTSSSIKHPQFLLTRCY